MQQQDIGPFKALSDPTRRHILLMLRDKDMTIAEVSENFDMTRAAVKKHLTMLCDGGLITVRSQGRERINRLNPNGMEPVLDWLSYFDGFWDERLSTTAVTRTLLEADTSRAKRAEVVDKLAASYILQGVLDRLSTR